MVTIGPYPHTSTHKSGHPPDDWNQLLVEARAEGQSLQRFAAGSCSGGA